MGSRPRDRVLKKKKKSPIFFYKWPKKVILGFFGTKACNPFNPKMPKKGPFIWPFLAFFGLFRLFWAFFLAFVFFGLYVFFGLFFCFFGPSLGAEGTQARRVKWPKKGPFIWPFLAFLAFL